MSIQHTESGTLITGAHTQVMRWITLIVGVRAEARPNALKMTRGPSMMKRARAFLEQAGVEVPKKCTAEKMIQLLEAQKEACLAIANAQEVVKQ